MVLVELDVLVAVVDALVVLDSFFSDLAGALASDVAWDVPVFEERASVR